MSRKIVKEADLPEIEVNEKTEEAPWLGKKVTSLTEDGELEDKTAEFVAVGYPHLRRSKDPSRTLYVPKIGGLDLDPVGFDDILGCAICRVGKEKPNVGASAKT